MTRWPFLVLMRTLKPDTRFRLRLVPSKVLLVMEFSVIYKQRTIILSFLKAFFQDFRDH